MYMDVQDIYKLHSIVHFVVYKILGARLSEPHTSESSIAIVYACLLAYLLVQSGHLPKIFHLDVRSEPIW